MTQFFFVNDIENVIILMKMGFGRPLLDSNIFTTHLLMHMLFGKLFPLVFLFTVKC
jgi:hypothetical protein